jgi:replicative DNA helicase
MNDNFFLHPPAESTTRYVQWYEKLLNTPGIDYGCVMDKRVIPLHRGDVMAVLARPGHGKSSFMAYMAKREANKIIERKTEKDECVIYVSWEQPIEELEAFFQSGVNYNSTDLAWGRVSLDIVKEHAIKRVGLPIWMIGYSIGDADKRKPPMTIDLVYDTIRAIRYEYGLQPTLILLDYLQIIPIGNKRSERIEQVTEATINSKHLAKDIGVPIIAGVQASRQADKHKDTPPSMDEAQWSSAIEQTADKQISLLRASKVMNLGEYIEIGNHEYEVTDNLMVIKLLKQRFDSGFGLWAVNFEPQTLTMADYTYTKLG